MEKINFSVDINKDVFVLYSYLNHYGYNLQSRTLMHPLRMRVRSMLKEKSTYSNKLNTYFQECEPSWPKFKVLLNVLYFLTPFPEHKLVYQGGLIKHLKTLQEGIPLKVNDEVIGWALQLPMILREFTDLTDIESIWRMYRRSIKMPLHLNLMVKHEVKQLMRIFRLSSLPYKITLVPNYLQAEYIDELVLKGNEINIITGGSLSLSCAKIVLHEIVHILIEPVFNQNFEKFSEYLPLLKPIAEKMKEIGHWQENELLFFKTVFSETFARAIATLFKSSEEQEKTLEWDTQQGFIYERDVFLALVKQGDSLHVNEELVFNILSELQKKDFATEDKNDA